MTGKDFFEHPRDASKVKSTIVEHYFDAWSKVMRGKADRIAYVDLFAGPGAYEDGTPSTPIRVLERALLDPVLASKLVTLFNDKNQAYADELRDRIESLPGIAALRNHPQVVCTEVNEVLARHLSSTKLVPSLVFLDPWGYKGLTRELIGATIHSWGCDCIFFFNYSRINAGIANGLIVQHMNALFGEPELAELRSRLDGEPPPRREMLVLDALTKAVQSVSPKALVLPFCFRDETDTRTSHHIVFVSKHILGYTIMKKIMAAASSKHEQGVASFSYCPADITCPQLFTLARPLDDLRDMLMQDFAGQRVTVRNVFQRHHVGKRFIESNYKKALLDLENDGSINCSPPASSRQTGTIGDAVIVSFPKSVRRS